jgi:hypothetical protein
VSKKNNTAKKQTIQNEKNTYTLDPSKKETTSGLFAFAGEISEDFDKVSWRELLEDYSRMRNGGAVESSTVSILKYPILRAGYTILHENPEVEDYARWSFRSLIDSFGDSEGDQEFLAHLFLALEFGCSFFEKIYANGVYTPEGKITNVIKRLAPFKAETIDQFHYDEEMKFSGIRHERREVDSLNTFIDIPVEKLFFYSHNAEYGDPRGRSEYRPIRNLFKIKTDILLATARAQQRGAGIPEIKINKVGMNPDEEARAKAIGKSIGNMKAGYVVTDADTTVTLHSLQIQGSPETMLEFINREMFFNTLTEFMTSGIGQSGSRSATSEHKGSYELKCGVVTQAVEKRINILLREMIDISYLGTQAEYPTFKFNALQQTDIVSASGALTSFFTTGLLTKQEGDEDFVRSLFNMPPKQLVNGVEVVGEINTPNNVNNVTTINKNGLSSLKMLDSFSGKKLDASEQLEFLKKTFDVERAENLYTSIQDQADEIILDVMKKYINYLGRQAEAGQPAELKYNVELSNRLNKLYRDGHEAGIEDVSKEIQKAIDGKELAGKPNAKVGVGDTVKTSSQSIERFATRLLFNIKTVVEDEIDQSWNKARGSVLDFIISKKFEDGFKTDRRTLIQKAVDGYIDGRGKALHDNVDNIELYYYNSILDTNLCDTCAVLTGSVMTQEEAESQGLLTGTGRGRVNSHCLGGVSRCRCNLVPYKLKGGFKI